MAIARQLVIMGTPTSDDEFRKVLLEDLDGTISGSYRDGDRSSFIMLEKIKKCFQSFVFATLP